MTKCKSTLIKYDCSRDSKILWSSPEDEGYIDMLGLK